MKKCYLLLSLLWLVQLATAQIVTLSPPTVGPDDPVILRFDATAGNGELAGADKVYLHHGVVISGPDGTEWNYVIGNWGQDDGIGEMSAVPGEPDQWQIEFSPSIREYFGVPAGENIFRIATVFRSADGNVKGTIAPGEYGWGTVASNYDIYVDLNVSNYISIASPLGDQSFLQPGATLSLAANASAEVSSMKIWVDEGSGFTEVASADSGTYLSYDYQPSATGLIQLRFTATIGGEELEVVREHNVIILEPPVIASLPAGAISGINYHDTDDTKVILVLQAPEKEFAYVVGDFTSWNVLAPYQMNRTPDGEYFWLEIGGLTPQQPYVFQYWVDGDVKIGDPYAGQVADPWNDGQIDAVAFPDLPAYELTGNGIATVLQTGQQAFSWDGSEANWERPGIDHLVIYELLVRDFLESHSYSDLQDTLAYIKELGVDAIEIMPFNEFEGNESWGYNPSYYFAPDKYYGNPDQLKSFIQAAHQNGLAVVMDMVMNHAYGQNAMVQLYFDHTAGKPAENNPWFNRDYVGPYQWGYDWDHESAYTQEFLDRLNAYWIEEYHVDGYRFDFTKGFTNYAPGGNIDGFDQSRIDILKRMADEIWAVDPETYIILEHWGPPNEEQQLADYGMKMWRNRSYDFVPATTGAATGNFNNLGIESHVSYFDSHDERRIAEHALTEGLSNGSYNVKDPLVMYERVKMAAAFCFLFPGPKMIWQFDELGYDIDINFNGRVGNKPLPWGPGGLGYYEDSLRQYIYQAYQGILDVRRQIGAANLASAASDHQNFGAARRLSYDLPGGGIDLVAIGNFGLEPATIPPNFSQTGTWYDYFSGESLDVTQVDDPIELKAGEWHLYTTEQLSPGLPGVVEVYDNPVSIEPYPFTKHDEITVTFDATRAWPGDTDGLIDADKVYFHSGVVLSHPDSTNWQNVVGTLTDDGLGLMTEVADNIWQITLIPKDYYGLEEDEEAFKLAMTFRDADNANVGLGFRNSAIYFNIESDRPFVTIEPPAFEIDDEITITFNARRGNRELVDADKVYIHSSVDLSNTTTPQNTAWQHTVGDWGQDNGIGQMTAVPGETDLWEITLVPKDYYGLNTGDIAYWLAAVFRNADGSKKGTGTPGPIENGFIHTNLDFFLQNQLTVAVDEPENDGNLRIFPNPTSGQLELALPGWSGDIAIEVWNPAGQLLNSRRLVLDGSAGQIQELDLQDLPAGLYYLRIAGQDRLIGQAFVKY